MGCFCGDHHGGHVISTAVLESFYGFDLQSLLLSCFPGYFLVSSKNKSGKGVIFFACSFIAFVLTPKLKTLATNHRCMRINFPWDNL